MHDPHLCFPKYTLTFTQYLQLPYHGVIWCLLPSATKLRRLCFYRCVSVHRGGGIPACLAGGIPACLAAGLQGGVLSQHVLQVVSQHDLQHVSRGGVPGLGVSAPGGSGLGGLVWGGVCLVRGVCSWGLVSQHALRQTPRERRLLLRTVRIPLECILVLELELQEPI